MIKYILWVCLLFSATSAATNCLLSSHISLKLENRGENSSYTLIYMPSKAIQLAEFSQPTFFPSDTFLQFAADRGAS